MNLDGTVALVTGASRGIGHAVSAALRDAGADVIMVARGERALRDAASRIGGVAYPADVSDREDVGGLVHVVRSMARKADGGGAAGASAEESGGRLAADGALGGGGAAPDVVVSAAGAFSLAPIAETDPAAFERQIAANLRAPFLLMRAFLPAMLERGSGHVVTLGSVAGRRAFPHNGAYSASKFGVRGLHTVLNQELRGTGVRATLVEPAATDTPLWDDVDYSRHPGLPPREAMLRPEAVADGVLFALTRPPEVDVRVIALDRT